MNPDRRVREVRTDTGSDVLREFEAVLAAGDVPVVTGAGWPAEAREAVMEGVTRRRPVLPDEPVLVVLTSGSTGAPRAVVRTLASWASSHPAFERAVGLLPGDTVWAPGSLSSTLTLFAAHHARATGRGLVASGPWRGVEAARRLGAADATLLHAVPAVVNDALDAVAAGLLPALRTVVTAGAHPPPRLAARAAALGVRAVEYYGAAELSFVTVGGRPIDGAQVRLDDGVIRVRSPYLALGYLEAGGGPMNRDEGGWASVGDRGRWRPDGTLEVLGRAGDAVSVGGHTVVTGDVEAVLRSVSGVVEVVCVGEPHPRLGHRLVAVVRVDAGADPLPALRATARAALPAASRPSRWVVVDDLPRTPGGKIARDDVTRLLLHLR